jgi:hypothetical protein
MPSLWSYASTAFRKLWTTLFPPNNVDATYRRWSDHRTREARYHILNSFYDQTAYSGFAGRAVKEEFRAYRHIRPVYNACGQIVEFAATHLMGGQLDPDAGDGHATPSCLPILAGDGADPAMISRAVASMWRASNWQVKKTLYCRWGAVFGDVGLEVIADEARRLVRLRVVHPGEIESVAKDPYGNVRSYTLRRWEVDPEDEAGQRLALYREIVTNVDGVVTYRTTKDGGDYAWPGTPGYEWRSRFGFVPLVLVQNIDMGGDWGTSELQGALFKTVERDGQGSNTSDAAMKAVNGPWFLTGSGLPAPAPATRPYDGDPFAPQTMAGRGAVPNLEINVEERDGLPIVTCNAPDAKMTAMVFPVSVDALDRHIATVGDALDQAYPELRIDSARATTASSAKALRELKKRAAKKVVERRAAYDGGLVRAQMMGMTMGGMLGFPDFAGFDESSFSSGREDHRIGPRTVFDSDPLDVLEEQQARAMVVKTYMTAGVPMDEAMRQAGIGEEDVAAALASKAAADAAALEKLRQAQVLALADVPADAGAGQGGGAPAKAGANGFGGY